MFDPDDLKAAVAKTIATATVPAHHGFATVVDLHGAHVALATKTETGWSIALDGGYVWAGDRLGPDVHFTIGKSW